MKKNIAAIVCLLSLTTFVSAQETEVRISLEEQFFEALLEAVFTKLDQPKVPLSLGAAKDDSQVRPSGDIVETQGAEFRMASFRNDTGEPPTLGLTPGGAGICDETVRLKPEIDGVRTAVKFRKGGIIAPIAFEGNYNPPLIGCIGFSGWAETTIDLTFDQSKNALVGNARVLKVNLSGTNGIGGSIITRLVQNSIDRKINPIEIVKLDMLSFTAPIQNSGKLRMEAIAIRHEVKDRQLDVYIKYRFIKPDVTN